MKTKARLFAVSGLIAGVLAALGLGLVWPSVFPAILWPEHYYGPGPGFPIILAITSLAAAPAAAVGGLIGARLPREGGQTEQVLVAAIVGIVLGLPFSCGALWFFTGW